MKTLLRDNGLTLVLMTLFLVSLVGQAVTGLGVENQQRSEHGEALIGMGEFLRGGQFLSTLFENWESEFLQMWAYVMLTAFLFQRGSPESKDPDKENPQDRDPALDADKADAPWAVRAGGFVRWLYSQSLGLAMMLLFLISFWLHLGNSTRLAADEARQHGEPAPGVMDHLRSAEFWFESFQNWQSEFLATAVLVVLAIVLRQRGSPESKPVAAPHGQTGTD
jgi:glycerol uptake facilitator-like aquaporin